MTTSTPAQPRRHHYIPVFYLRRWAGDDGRLCQFSREGETIKPLRRSPKATGFVRSLYELQDFPPTLSQQIETNFFRPVDSFAADALSLMEKHGNKTPWNGYTRSAWTRFIMSLLLRCPEDLHTLKNWWSGEFFRTDAEQESSYQSSRSDADPLTFSEFLSSRPPQEVEKFKFEFLFKMINSELVGSKINNFLWKILDFTENCVPLLTSDRPIIRTNGLLRPNGHLVMPIGPRKLFVATKDESLFIRIDRISKRQLAKEINQHVVRRAVKYVYAVNDKHLAFIAQNFGTVRETRLIEELVNAPQSPSPAIGLVPTEPPI